MRFSTVILSLAVASAVYAAPAPVHLSKRNTLISKIESLVSEAVSTLECGACEAALVGIKDVALLNKGWAISALIDICPTVSKMPANV
ncbi:hypothetical protein BGZ46_004759, partial [Entomortierella lignicola]